jgi:hypothetical protein
MICIQLRLGFIPQFNCATQELAIVFLEQTLDVQQLIRSGIGTQVADWHEPHRTRQGVLNLSRIARFSMEYWRK